MSGRRRSILVADDLEDNRRLVIYQLGRLGEFEYLEARDGLEVLDLLGRRRPDLVVMDLRMPRLDGWQTLAALAALPDRASFRVLAVSAGGAPDDEVRARVAGCDDYLSAIFADVVRFRRTVERLLARDD